MKLEPGQSDGSGSETLVKRYCIVEILRYILVAVKKYLGGTGSSPSFSCTKVALNGLENILRLGEQEAKETGSSNPYAVIIEEVFGLDKIEFLQSHENMEIYQKAFDIIERYFGTEEEDKEVTRRSRLTTTISFLGTFYITWKKGFITG